MNTQLIFSGPIKCNQQKEGLKTSCLTRCFMRVLNPNAWSRLANQSAVLSSLQIVGTGKLDVLITNVSPRLRSWLSLPSKLTLASALLRDRDNQVTNE